MNAVIESVGGVASQVRLGSHTLVFDQPSSLPGGEDRGPSPLDVMVASVGACAHYFAAAFLFARKISPAGLRVEVDGDKAHDPSPRIARLSIHITLPATVAEHYLPLIERAVRNCPTYGTLVHPPELNLTFAKATVEEAPAA